MVSSIINSASSCCDVSMKWNVSLGVIKCARWETGDGGGDTDRNGRKERMKGGIN